MKQFWILDCRFVILSAAKDLEILRLCLRMTVQNLKSEMGR